ncbi:mannose-1-phosphate guanylyltransferase [Patescibacteria group bacterium]|nr:MAG: mannose-1-phosphate guanylyltransferase [Patescibacteria group bacterium]
MLTPILMAGGAGTRLWPLSRAGAPKQLQALFDQETMLQKSAARLSRGFGAKRLWVATTREYLDRVRRELPQIPRAHISVEPMKKETAPALGLALVRILHKDPEAFIVYANADNFVRDVGEFLRILKVAESLARAEPDRLVLVGIRPAYPDTGLGYIRMGDLLARVRRRRGEDEIFSVRAFVEKPNQKTAERYVQSWEYLWNPTLIVAKASTLFQKYARHLPAMHERLVKIKNALGTVRENAVINREFAAIAPTTIDYGILEKEKGMAVIPADFGWTDVGSWRAVHEILAASPQATVARGPHLAIDSGGNLLVSAAGKLIATVGVHDMVVVETEDAVLVCPKSRSQEVKKLVEVMVKRKLKKYL